MQKATINPDDDTLNDTLNDIEKQILEIIVEHPKITYAEIAQMTNTSRIKVARNLKSLAERRFISRIGAKKTGYWSVNKK